MKKIIALALSMVMILALAACGAAETGAPLPGTTASGTAAVPPGTTAAAAGAETTAPAPSGEKATEPAVTEPSTEPEATEDSTPTEEAGYILKSGTPAFGESDGNTYVNESISMTCVMPEGVGFAPEAAMLETNQVTTVEAALVLDATILAMTTDSSLAVAAYKLGTKEVNNKTDVAAALQYLVNDDSEYLEILGATVGEPEEANVIFTAGTAKAWILTASHGDQQSYYLYAGYEVGDHMIAIMLQSDSEAMLDELLAGIDVE